MNTIKTTFILILLLSLHACGDNSAETESIETETQDTTSTAIEVDSTDAPAPMEEEKPKSNKLTWSDVEDPFYIIALNAFEKEEDAIAWVEERTDWKKKAGYLWIPDFKSLSGAEKFAVFYGPFEHDECYDHVEALRKEEEPGAYGLGIDSDGNRLEFRGWDNTTYNKKDVRALTEESEKIVFVFDPFPEDEASEDWGWFAAQVQEFCGDNDIIVTGVMERYDNVVVEMPDGEPRLYDLSEFLDLESRGYVMLHGYKRGFVPHDMPDGVKMEVAGFFGFEVEN